MQYTSSHKCRKNTLLERRKSTSLLLTSKDPLTGYLARSVLWWAMRKLGIDEWIVRLVKIMYDGANSRVRLNGCFSGKFEVTVGEHQGSVLSPLRFAIVMEAISVSLVNVVLVALGSSYVQVILPS